VKALAFLLVLLLQAPEPTPLLPVRTALRQLATELDAHQSTFGAAPGLTTAKHQLRDWVEGRLGEQTQTVDARAFAAGLHIAIRDAALLCDDCDWNALGYVDDVRVRRQGDFLIVVIPTGISCGYDESAYLYAWDGGRWRRVWDHEQESYTPQTYRPQTVHDLQVSPPDASGSRLVLVLGSQTICGGAYRDVYARAWRLDASYTSSRVLDWSGHANDEYPPILGRVGTDDVLVQFTAGGMLSGDVHPALRHFVIRGNTAAEVDPIASRPRDFVVEWLSSPWETMRPRTESPLLESQHTQLHRDDGVGDFSEPTLRCTGGSNLWQVGTRLYERPKRYFRVRWTSPYTFSVVDISEAPYADCTVKDTLGEVFPTLFGAARQ
jgi:hypothetical protein